MAVAVIIPTCNRPAALKAMVLSILNGTTTPDELIVVDQSRGRETAQMIHGLQGQSGALGYLKDEGSGTSRAKNLGWRTCRSDLVVFTDDDAIVDVHWLENLIAAAAEHPHSGILGGRILIPNLNEYETVVFPQDKWYLLPCLDWGDAVKPFPSGSYPVGVNLLTRRSLLEALGGFNEDLGPNYAKRRTVSGEETDFCQRAEVLGSALTYVGTAIVFHPLIPQRNTIEFLHKRLAFELYTAAVFEWSLASRWEYFSKIWGLIRWILVVYLKRLRQTELERFLSQTEFQARVAALIWAPRSLRRARRRLARGASCKD